MGMLRRISVILCGLLMMTSMAMAQEVTSITSCDKAHWQANSESDLAGYRLYISKNGVVLPFVTVAKDQTSILCSTLGIVEDGEYLVAITAFDTSNNESTRTVANGLKWPDLTAPTPPSGWCWDVTVNGEPKKLCMTVTSRIIE